MITVLGILATFRYLNILGTGILYFEYLHDFVFWVCEQHCVVHGTVHHAHFCKSFRCAMKGQSTSKDKFKRAVGLQLKFEG